MGVEGGVLRARAVTPEAYAPYGDLIAAADSRAWRSANFGRARRFDGLATLENLRPERARLNICVFRCGPFIEPSLSIDLLERHPFSTQVFVPMRDGRYVTIVALGGDSPDLESVAAFIVAGPVGISYRPGVWHYPMTALGHELDLACLVYEDGSGGDCEVQRLPQPFRVSLADLGAK